MLVKGYKVTINMSQICTICEIIKDKSEVNQLKRNKEVRLTKSSKDCNLEMYENKKKNLELTCQYLRIRRDGSKTADS